MFNNSVIKYRSNKNRRPRNSLTTYAHISYDLIRRANVKQNLFVDPLSFFTVQPAYCDQKSGVHNIVAFIRNSYAPNILVLQD